MTPKKQVSPAIRILRGERDASARATHLEAATRKFLVTTNERKQMSTKTNFKRVALVAVAALGMGVLSSVPSSAMTSGVTITVADGTSGQNNTATDSRTAAVITVAGFVGAGDSLVVTAVQKSVPDLAAGIVPVFYNLDSNTPTLSTQRLDTNGATSANTVAAISGGAMSLAGKIARVGQVTNDTHSATLGARISVTADANISQKFGLQLDSSTTTRAAGTYTYTIVVRIYEAGATNLATPTTQTISKDVSIVIAATAAQGTTVTPGFSTAFLGTSSTSNTSDAVLSFVATASSTPVAYVSTRTYNSTGTTAAAESVTATISGAGILSFGGISGASLTIAGDGSDEISVLPNGVAGTATITISTTTRTFPAKTMTFFAVAPTTLVASVATPNAAIGSNSDVVRVTAKDSTGVSWAGALYLYASTAADALIAGSLTTPVLCTWDANDDRHECSVTGTTAGTAKFKAINASTVAAATVTSNEVSVVVSQASAATVKLEFDKASYAPGERARIYVTPLDSTGKAMQATAFTNLLATGGISTASALTFAGSTTTADSLTAVAITTKGNSSSTSGAKAGSMEYTVYMPVGGGTVTISATGGSSLPIAGRVAVTASATVTDSGAAALAAVSALATTVASLKTLITTLTNLVLKIQKKVKA